MNEKILSGFDATKIELNNWEGFKKYLNPNNEEVNVSKMNLPEGFYIKTKFGFMIGKKGDYLVIKSDGNKLIESKYTINKYYIKLENKI